MKFGLIGLGDMGAAVGRSLIEAGHDVVSVFDGRSRESTDRASAAGIKDVPNLTQFGEVDVVLSIVPPGVAKTVAEEFVQAMGPASSNLLYADLNAIAPATTESIASALQEAGYRFADGGIIGAAPYKFASKTRIYLSGEHALDLAQLNTEQIKADVCGAEIGQASGLKMVYAALTKGTATLHTAVLLAAHRMGLSEPLLGELEASQADRLQTMRGSVPFIAADSVRWADEMDEIAACFGALGITDGFHRGAGEIFRLLAKTPLEQETRETMDRSRTLEQAIEIYGSVIE